MPIRHRLSLFPHPASISPAGVRVAVELEDLGERSLNLCYRISDPNRLIRFPGPLPPEPVDGLWRHTCCEAFIAGLEGSGYSEFNLSPSGQWAAYRFDDYRKPSGQGAAGGWSPSIRFVSDGEWYRLSASIDGCALPPGVRLVALACVLETLDGEHSWWALRHPAERPDFHHRGSFTLLPAKDSGR